MTALFPPRNRSRSRLTSKDVTELGVIGADRYVTFDGAEYLMARTPMSEHEVPDDIADDEIRVEERFTEMQYGAPHSGVRGFRGMRVPNGTYAALLRKRDKRLQQAEAQVARRPVDLLADLRGEAVVPWLDRHGVTVELTSGGKLLARARGGFMSYDVRHVLTGGARLIVAELEGNPIQCETGWRTASKHGPAVTILFPDVAACADCGR